MSLHYLLLGRKPSSICSKLLWTPPQMQLQLQAGKTAAAAAAASQLTAALQLPSFCHCCNWQRVVRLSPYAAQRRSWCTTAWHSYSLGPRTATYGCPVYLHILHVRQLLLLPQHSWGIVQLAAMKLYWAFLQRL